MAQGDSVNKILPKATSPSFNLQLLETGGPKSPRKFLKIKKLELKIPISTKDLIETPLSAKVQRKFGKMATKIIFQNFAI